MVCAPTRHVFINIVPSSGEYARATSVDSSTNVSAQVPQRACQVVRDILDTNLLAIFPVNSYR